MRSAKVFAGAHVSCNSLKLLEEKWLRTINEHNADAHHTMSIRMIMIALHRVVLGLLPWLSLASRQFDGALLGFATKAFRQESLRVEGVLYALPATQGLLLAGLTDPLSIFSVSEPLPVDDTARSDR